MLQELCLEFEDALDEQEERNKVWLGVGGLGAMGLGEELKLRLQLAAEFGLEL